MRDPFPLNEPLRPPEHARDLQARLFREIGISAVAAALRCTTLPDPGKRIVEPTSGVVPHHRGDLAA